MHRIILHIDMDYFFAQIEERENPHLKGKPLVVGADPKKGKGRGVVSTANYEARTYGIHSGMPISRAYQLCPNAVFLPPNFQLYEECSRNIMKIIKKYSPVYEVASLDEAYLDVSFAKTYFESKFLGVRLKKEILIKERLTATIGLGPNKLIAKMASKMAKPDGLLVVRPHEIKNFLEPLDIEELPGIGEKANAKLRALGINKIKDLENLSKTELKEMFGRRGIEIYQRARGVDEKPVSQVKIAKSIGKEHTFEKDTRDPEIIFGVFDEIIKNVWQELLLSKRDKQEPYFKTITVVCRFQGFETHTKSKTILKEKTANIEVLKKEAKKLLLKFLLESKKQVRLIGLRVKL